MIDQSFNSFIRDLKISDHLGKTEFLSFDEHREGDLKWRIIPLNRFEVALRSIFGVFGAYKSTHQDRICQALKNEIKEIAVFDTSETRIEKIICAAKGLQSLKHLSENDEIVVGPVEKKEKICNALQVDVFEKTLAFVQKNQSFFSEMKREGISLKLRPSALDGLFSVRVDSGSVVVLTKKQIGEGGFKRVKTAYDIDNARLLARATMTIGDPKTMRLVKWLRKRMARQEMRYLEKAKDDPTCIQLRSSYEFLGRKDRHKIVMLMDLADGDLQDLADKNSSPRQLNAEQKYDIIGQLLDALLALSEKNIWHRDIKPLNFLYFLDDNGKYRVVTADFGLAAKDRDFVAEKLVAGTHGFMPPETDRLFRLFNGKEGGVFAMAKTIESLMPSGERPPFLEELLQKMMADNPKNRPSAQEARNLFKEGLLAYQL